MPRCRTHGKSVLRQFNFRAIFADNVDRKLRAFVADADIRAAHHSLDLVEVLAAEGARLKRAVFASLRDFPAGLTRYLRAADWPGCAQPKSRRTQTNQQCKVQSGLESKLTSARTPAGLLFKLFRHRRTRLGGAPGVRAALSSRSPKRPED